MNRFLMLTAVVAACLMSGCGLMRDTIFEAMSDAYTGGGYSHEDRQRHYDREIERYRGGPQHYDPVLDR